MFILNFHGLGQPPYKVPAEEEPYWLEPRFFEDILDAVADRKDVRITFDDSNHSDFAIALPLLKARKLKAQFFHLAGYVGRKGFLSAEEIRLLCAEGMGIGSHGLHHRKWTALNDKELHRELVEAREALEQIAGVPVSDVACPFGAYNRRVLRKLHGLGFRTVYTSDAGSTSVRSWIQPRNTVERSNDLKQVLAMVTPTLCGFKGLGRDLRLFFKRCQ